MPPLQRTRLTQVLPGLLGWLGVCLITELSAVAFLPGRWYAHLHKASWTPPSYLFAPVWTLMYVLMAIAAWLVWRCGGWSSNGRPLSLFIFQLALNGLWSFICFRLHNLQLSVLDMTLLWVVLCVITRSFWRISSAAGGLMLVYLLWVTLAASLNMALWWLNRQG